MKFPIVALVLLFVACFFNSASAQTCTIDPITGKQRCTPIRNVVNAITPDRVVSPIKPATFTVMESAPSQVVSNPVDLTASSGCNCGPLCNCSLQVQSPVAYSVPVATYSAPVVTYSPPVSQVSWSKSWTKVHGQPVKNLARRVVGR